ncbi:MAG: 2-amino-4-hydroxy-6-hydroxymethyldihydropteridine diphosphokinase [Candidatus Hydrogenedentes bacterium]|nr:2-amino-4-hydroxy-6-hydroxymethyldihydropteridine diphosphokinase [Candidatus Hydrogenedentota bacterium]
MDEQPFSARVLLSLGSNLGDRKVNLEAALAMLAETPGVRVLRQSRVYETMPVGVVDQPEFLNLAAEIETDLAPLELLNVAQDIERRLGRTPTFRWGPRVLDIDIILWGRQVIREARLEVPHPRFRERFFVLVPLAEIAPDAVDPETGRTVAELAAGLGKVKAAGNGAGSPGYV